jgi:hypothetical protein
MFSAIAFLYNQFNSKMKPLTTGASEANDEAAFLQKENKIFINSLSQICQTYPKMRQNVSSLVKPTLVLGQSHQNLTKERGAS